MYQKLLLPHVTFKMEKQLAPQKINCGKIQQTHRTVVSSVRDQAQGGSCLAARSEVYTYCCRSGASSSSRFSRATAAAAGAVENQVPG